MSDPVTELACALGVAYATIDGALAKLADTLTSVEHTLGAPADTQLAVAGAVNEMAKNPDALFMFANPEAWRAGVLYGHTLGSRAAVLTQALKRGNTTEALEAFLNLRRDLAGYASGRKCQPLPAEKAVPRWEIRRACLPATEEQARLAELEASEVAEARARKDAAKNVRFEVAGRPFDLPFPTAEALKGRFWRPALQQMGELFDFSGLRASAAFERELQRLRDAIEHVATEHPLVARVLVDHFRQSGIDPERSWPRDTVSKRGGRSREGRP